VIVSEDVERYAQEHTTPPEELSQELEAETKATLSLPEMLAGLSVSGLEATKRRRFTNTVRLSRLVVSAVG